VLDGARRLNLLARGLRPASSDELNCPAGGHHLRPTFNDAAAQPRRLLTWTRRVFDMVVIGAMLLAAVETIAFLRGLVG
jgi:hypothetical protein